MSQIRWTLRESIHEDGLKQWQLHNMTSNNLHVFREDTRFNTRNIEQHHTIPKLTDVTPIPDATVNSGPDAEAFPQELTNYMEEVCSQRIPPMVYIEGNNREVV